MFILGIKRLNIQWIIGFKHLRLDKGRYIFRPLSAGQSLLKRQLGHSGRNIYRKLTDGIQWRVPAFSFKVNPGDSIGRTSAAARNMSSVTCLA
jgi:hypothetical protein